ncbi:hypothetical phosphatase/phosphohexomutase [Photobacterium profundum SS9]|uniref:Hypothetical phosphatase/phosphohexomutase n=2 Tax=Photobacterium profundum TaxID=74109 RepID=Q6LQ24_PHOPR|nr:hypothetical phosphatase/phosphohexomutase [Photobacterium profundum SS9]
MVNFLLSEELTSNIAASVCWGNKMRAICFDFDGTLVDSEVFHAENWSGFLKTLDIDFSMGAFLEQYAGVTWDKVAIDLFTRFSISMPIEHMLQQMEAITEKALILDNIPAKSGVSTLLHELSGKVPLAVVTGAPRIYVEGILQRHGWLELFDHVFCGEDVASNKPAPDIYQLACATLGFNPHEVLAIEDSVTGIKSSLSAGLKTVLVNDTDIMHPSKYSVEYGQLALDYSFDSMNQAHPTVLNLATGSIRHT